MVKKRYRRKSSRTEENPMEGTSNIVDAMLVISVGLLIFLVMAWNMQTVVFNNEMTPQEKQEVMNTISEVSKVKQGEQLNETPDTSNNSGDGYVEMGKVYKDSKTGKLIMIE